MKTVHIFLLTMITAFLFSCAPQVHENKDPLPSWNDGENKQAIIEFVTKITDKNSGSYVPPADRIATFDNDGTLWSEQPIYFQFQFVFDRIKSGVDEHPEWLESPIIMAVLENDIQALLSFNEHALLGMIMEVISGMNNQAYREEVVEWLKTAKHPQSGKRYTEMVYQPMLELLDYLRENEFKNYIVSGGGVEFMRPWTMDIYGIPAEQVIGSTLKTRYEMTDSGPVIMRLPEIDFFNDKAGKPVAINKYIGRKPIFAAGNSDGDLQMLQWSDANTYPSYQLYVHHTDAEREWAYDRDSHIGKLDKGLDEALNKGWTVIDMKNDWKVIYP